MEFAIDALLHEFKALLDNMNRLADFAFLRDLPVLMILASPPGGHNETADWSPAKRKRLVEPLQKGKVIKLPAGHSGIYWLFSDDIARETLAFF